MLLSLPTELVIQTFSHLSSIDITSCRLTCKYLFSVVRDSVYLQYHMALIGARATDNPCSALPLSTKLEQLKNGEKAWAVLKPNFTTTIPVKHNPSGIYDLTGGVYLLGNHNRRDLHYVRLPSHPEEEPEWSTIHVGRTIIDMGLCVYEHDLIAVVTTTPKLELPVTYDIELILFEFSTCKPHPQAQKHVIHVMNTPWEKPAIGIEIVGDNLVLVLYHHHHIATPDDRVFIFEWKTAVTKMSFAVPYDTYTGLIFLDEHTILLPNTQTNALDIFRIPSIPILDTGPIMSLLLPRLAENRTVGGISCRAEPNPIGTSSYIHKAKEAKERAAALGDGPQEDMFPKRGYLADAEHAICIFALRVQGAQIGQFHFGHTFTFVVLRKALLDAVAGFELVQAQRQGPEIGLPSTAHLPSVAWAEWGPDVTRWFNSDSIPTRWITTTAGQRCVLIADSAPDTGFPYVVLNFNMDSVRRMKGWLKARRMREKAREQRAREDSRERAVEEARMWAEATGATHGGAGEDGGAEGDDDESWYDIGQDEEERRGSPIEYHTGLAIVDGDDLPNTLTPGEASISWETADLDGDMAASTSAAAASTSAVTRHADGDGEDMGDDQMEHVDSDLPAQSNGHAHHDTDAVELDAEPMSMDLDADTSEEYVSPPQPESPQSSSSSGRASTSETAHSSIEFDSENPLDGPDNTVARRIWCVTTSEMVEPADTFAEHVEGRLPYVACASARTYQFHGVLLDEERVIGIRTDSLDRIRMIEVHHFG